MTALHTPTASASVRQEESSAAVRRLADAGGLVFVATTLLGNSLTGSVVEADADLDGPQALADLAALSGSGTAQLGLAFELVGLVALMVFVGSLADRLRSRGATAACLAVAGGVMLAVKLASGSALLAGLAHHEDLSPDVALALVSMNDAAFVLCWLPFSILVLAVASGLGRERTVGRPTALAGGVLGALCLVAAVMGVLDSATAVPVPFLLCVLWVAVVSGRVALGRRG